MELLFGGHGGGGGGGGGCELLGREGVWVMLDGCEDMGWVLEVLVGRLLGDYKCGIGWDHDIAAGWGSVRM